MGPIAQARDFGRVIDIESHAMDSQFDVVARCREVSWSQGHDIAFPNNPDTCTLMWSAYGCGNIMALINDIRVDPFDDVSAEPAKLEPNVAYVEVYVDGWVVPCIFVIDTVYAGNDFRVDYGDGVSGRYIY